MKFHLLNSIVSLVLLPDTKTVSAQLLRVTEAEVLEKSNSINADSSSLASSYVRSGASRLLQSGTCQHDSSIPCAVNADCNVPGSCISSISDVSGTSCQIDDACPPNKGNPTSRGYCEGFSPGKCVLPTPAPVPSGTSLCGTCAVQPSISCFQNSDCPQQGKCDDKTTSGPNVCTSNNQCLPNKGKDKGSCVLSATTCDLTTCAPSASPSISFNPTVSSMPSTSNAPTCRPNPVVPSPTEPVTYIPGENTLTEADLSLSTGLRAEVIARTGQKVPLSNGQQSAENFHTWPDGAAVFPDECGGGWTYVSNSEDGGSSSFKGGVGAIYFNANNEVVDYKMIQKDTRVNCSGGKTPWGTWLTCEETSGGGVYEVHPKNDNPLTKRKTLLGQSDRNGGYYEAVAYDYRDTNSRPSFFLTEDTSNGPLERFRPSIRAFNDAKASGDYSNLLHIDPDGTATTDYLVITPSTGKFIWSSSLSSGRSNANNYFRNCEGIDVRNGKLYMTCKVNQQLFVLDLDALTYVESSTESGAFNDQPDQIATLTGTNGDILYFCEDGISGGTSGSSGGGIHARDATGQGYTILQDETSALSGETTGLAFSPDRMLMIFAFQQGRIYKVWREDGHPFGGPALDIRYHNSNNNIFTFDA